MLNLAIGLVAYLLLFFYTYILVMGVYRAHLSNRLKGVLLYLCLPVVGVGYLLDVVANVFIATVFFVELPKEFLVTTRLSRYVAESKDWRFDIALAICDNLLDPFDPTGNHC